MHSFSFARSAGWWDGVGGLLVGAADVGEILLLRFDPPCGEWIFYTDDLVFGGLVGCWSSCRGVKEHVVGCGKGCILCSYILCGFS